MELVVETLTFNEKNQLIEGKARNLKPFYIHENLTRKPLGYRMTPLEPRFMAVILKLRFLDDAVKRIDRMDDKFIRSKMGGILRSEEEINKAPLKELRQDLKNMARIVYPQGDGHYLNPEVYIAGNIPGLEEQQYLVGGWTRESLDEKGEPYSVYNSMAVLHELEIDSPRWDAK